MFEWEAGSGYVQRALLPPPIGGEAGSCAKNVSVCLLSAAQSYALLHSLTDVQLCLKTCARFRAKHRRIQGHMT